MFSLKDNGSTPEKENLNEVDIKLKENFTTTAGKVTSTSFKSRGISSVVRRRILQQKKAMQESEIRCRRPSCASEQIEAKDA